MWLPNVLPSLSFSIMHNFDVFSCDLLLWMFSILCILCHSLRACHHLEVLLVILLFSRLYKHLKFPPVVLPLWMTNIYLYWRSIREFHHQISLLWSLMVLLNAMHFPISYLHCSSFFYEWLSRLALQGMVHYSSHLIDYTHISDWRRRRRRNL